MRVTPTTMFLTVREGLQGSLARVQSMQAQLASGRRINRYSDAPADATSALRLRAQEEDWAAYGRAAEDAQGWLGTQDNALQSMHGALQRVRELTLAAANAVRTPAEREAMATEIDHLKQQMLATANTTYLGRAVFAGFGTTAVAAAGGGYAYTGDGGQVLRQIAPSVTVTANLDGAALLGFAAGSTNVFAMLDQVAADVRAGNTGALTASHLAAIDGADQSLMTGLSAVGARAALVESTRQIGLDALETIGGERSVLEDADIAEAAMHLQQAEIGYQASLAATARLSMPTLVEFLR